MGRSGTAVRLRRGLALLHDIAWIPASILAAYYARFNDFPSPYLQSGQQIFQLILLAIACHGTTLWWRGCYRGLWRFASLPDLIRLAQAVVLGLSLTAGAAFISGILAEFPRTVLILYPFILFGGTGAGRILYRAVRDRGFAIGFRDGERAIIAGGGHAGELLIRDLAVRGNYVPVAVLDDNIAKIGCEIHGIRVRGRLGDLENIARRCDAEAVLFAIPSAPPTVLKSVVDTCKALNLPCQTLPFDFTEVKRPNAAESLRPVKIEDLLGRDPVALSREPAIRFLHGRRILVTGGGGSIGSELCRQIARIVPANLTVLDHSERDLYNTVSELDALGTKSVQPCLGDVCNEAVLDKVFRTYRPEVVFHAAAYKHVPLVEANPLAGIRVNVLGTRCVAEAARRHGTKRFIQISTDKAVNPTGVMGATKRLAELYCRTAAKNNQCQFVITRFGNVLGSSGSVVPLFRRQIANGGPVTVTHPDITRYFMTIPEAVALILDASASEIAKGIFVLDMGKPVRIEDLARDMIRLSGLEAGVDIEIEYVGLRPGEKLHEELFYETEHPAATGHPKLLLAESEPDLPYDGIEADLQALENAIARNDTAAALRILSELVPGYCPLDGHIPDMAAGPPSSLAAGSGTLRLNPAALNF